MNWRPHETLPKRWLSDCGHYARTVVHGVAGSVYDAWFHPGQPDFEHVGFSRETADLDQVVTLHAKRKHIAITTPPTA